MKDVAIMSHCIVLSLSTNEPRTSGDVCFWLRASLLKSGKVNTVMAGPAGSVRPGDREAFILAAAVAAMPKDRVPPELVAARDAFVRAVRSSEDAN